MLIRWHWRMEVYKTCLPLSMSRDILFLLVTSYSKLRQFFYYFWNSIVIVIIFSHIPLKCFFLILGLIRLWLRNHPSCSSILHLFITQNCPGAYCKWEFFHGIPSAFPKYLILNKIKCYESMYPSCIQNAFFKKISRLKIWYCFQRLFNYSYSTQ